jgi:hypothetical protein
LAVSPGVEWVIVERQRTHVVEVVETVTVAQYWPPLSLVTDAEDDASTSAGTGRVPQ